jgi:hypothetical protein
MRNFKKGNTEYPAVDSRLKKPRVCSVELFYQLTFLQLRVE